MVRSDRMIRSATLADKKIWDSRVAHPLQSWSWGEFRQKTHVDVVRRLCEQPHADVSCWQLTFHRIPHTPWVIGYFPKGPLPTKEMLDDLTHIGKQKRAIYIQFEPDVTVNSRTSIIHHQFLRPSHHPLFPKYSFILDLTKSEDALMSAMSQKTRYNIRLAQKHGVEVKEDNSSAAFSAYLRLTKQTTGRQKFFAHSLEYHRYMWETLRTSGIARLFTATYKKNILAAWILFVWNDTLYYPYGASSREHREVMAPNLLLWETARWGKRAGLSHYDLWGALGFTPDPSDPWYGFHKFKEGYSPQLVEFVGSYDLVINPTLYPLYTAVDSLRWFILGLTR